MSNIIENSRVDPNKELVDEIDEEPIYLESYNNFYICCDFKGNHYREDYSGNICKYVKVNDTDYKWQCVFRNVRDDVVHNGIWRYLYKKDPVTRIVSNPKSFKNNSYEVPCLHNTTTICSRCLFEMAESDIL
jgi:hypothetical protein